MAQKTTKRADAVSVVYDADGVAINDITPLVEERFPAEGHGLVRRVYIEAVYNLLRPFRKAVAKKIDRGEREPKAIDPHAAASMRSVQENGDSVVMCTKNPLLYCHRTKAMLEDAGLSKIEVVWRRSGSKAKGIMARLKNVVVVKEDDAIEALRFASEGIDAALFQKDYNRILGWVASRINPRVHCVGGWEDERSATHRIIEKRRAELHAWPQPH